MIPASLKKITAVWIIAILALFVIAITFGILMRFNQGNTLNLSPVNFYILMTTHGLTMVGIWAVAGLAALNYLLARYVKVSTSLNIIALVMTVVGVAMLWVSTFLGKFHGGWTFSYPLPFHVMWAQWATPLFLASLAVLGVGWFLWASGMLLSILKKYTITQAFAWQHFKKSPSVETPPFILIATISLVGVIVALLSAVVLLVLYFSEYFSSGKFVNDALLMKNLTYFFGHTITNESLYLGLATLYELMPETSGRPKFKTTWYVALAWNCTLVFILTAFFHHLYMDFVQPVGFQIIGQMASYFASLPAASVTAFSVVVLIYKNPIKWSVTNMLFFIGIVGWLIGGVGAVIDATISNNIVLHNTLWVPAHFHTYNAMGNVLFSMAFFYWGANEFSGTTDTIRSFRFKIILLLLGGFGFVLMFYIAGSESIPRRFSSYPKEFTHASVLANVGGIFASIYIIAILLMMFNIINKCTKAFSRSLV